MYAVASPLNDVIIEHSSSMYKIPPLFPDFEMNTVKNSDCLLIKKYNSLNNTLDLLISSLKKCNVQSVKKIDNTSCSTVQKAANSNFDLDGSKPIHMSIRCDPKNPPLSCLLYVASLYRAGVDATIRFFKHSSVKNVEDSLVKFTEVFSKVTSISPKISLTVIWQYCTPDSIIVVDSFNCPLLYGEIIALSMLNQFMKNNKIYDEYTLVKKIDNGLLHGRQNERKDAIKSISKDKYFAKEDPISVIDLFLLSVALQTKTLGQLAKSMGPWMTKVKDDALCVKLMNYF